MLGPYFIQGEFFSMTTIGISKTSRDRKNVKWGNICSYVGPTDSTAPRSSRFIIIPLGCVYIEEEPSEVPATPSKDILIF